MATAPKKQSLSGLVIGEAQQVRDLVTMANKSTTTTNDAKLYLTSAMQHVAKQIDLIRKMARGPKLDVPDWFYSDNLTDLPRPSSTE